MNTLLARPTGVGDAGVDGQAIYVYAVVRRSADTPPALPASTVAIGYRDLLAVTRRVPLAQFSTAALPEYLHDPAWVQALALEHQTTLARLAHDYATLPCAFCTVYHHAERVQHMLAAQYDALDAALRRVAGATEWGVKLFYDQHALAKWLADDAEFFAPQRAAIARASSGAAYLLQKRLAQSADQRAAAFGTEYALTCHAELAAMARAATSSPPMPRSDHPAEIILHAAYLVDDQRHAQFMNTLASLQAASASRGVQIALAGPWPPYSFATLDTKDPV
ncbi:MAG: GvpL/GvpF family gas vesicle protein [Roseiflexaceae bacterium]|nr:GvpL/GvpF family gas vesicle protein [Roseiflexaceae bacterium]